MPAKFFPSWESHLLTSQPSIKRWGNTNELRDKLKKENRRSKIGNTRRKRHSNQSRNQILSNRDELNRH